MRVLFTGRGTSGSWQCRGEQLGRACGGAIKQGATVADCKAADIVLAVKRVNDELLRALRQSGRPWVFDVVDFYPQPRSYDWSKAQAVDWVRSQVKHLSPTAIVWPNQKMREDCDHGLPGLVLPHHHRPNIRLNPIREKVHTVGYEGAPNYLGRWREWLQAECDRRGWSFVVNPEHLADLDIAVAFRDGQGYVAFHWKSNVKLANAHGSGTPFVGQPECGYVETASGAEYWAESRNDLVASFDWLESQSNREMIRDRFLQRAYPVERAAVELKAFLTALF